MLGWALMASLSAPPSAPRLSALAVASLVVGLLLCVPFVGLVGIGLSIGALLRIRGSSGRLEGSPLAAIGMALAVFNLVFSATMAVIFWQDDGPLASAPITAPVVPAPVVPAPAPPPASDEGGQMTIIEQVTEIQVGAVRLVDVPPTKKSLEAELLDQRARAAAAGERMVLFTGAEGCRPCLSVAAVLADAQMQAGLSRVRLVRVDVNALGQELEDLGVPVKKIPGFYLLGKDLSPTDGISGGEWDDDTADNAGPVLGAFVKGTLKKRRERFVPQPRRQRPVAPRPTGTFL